MSKNEFCINDIHEARKIRASETHILFGFPEKRIVRVNGRALDYPAAETYDKLTPDEIKVICNEIQKSWTRGPHTMMKWDEQSPAQRLGNRLMAYWYLRGVEDSYDASVWHSSLTNYPDPAVAAEYRANGWGFRTIGGAPPENLRELEQLFLSPVIPDARLIIDRCPQMAMIHALRGNVSEPYWWAALSIMEHATPNLSRECSDGYPGFSDEELAYRVKRIHTESIKPALCERLDQVNPCACSLCKFKGTIRSPMALGYANEPKKKQRNWHA